MHNKFAGTRPTVSRGFTLVEVMVALVIFSIGLLGLAGLQASGIRSNNLSMSRSMAMIQAYNIADRIRANAAGMANGDYDNVTTTIGGAPTSCIANQCTPDQLAAFDIWEWNNFNKKLLPKGRGTVTRINPAPATLFRITVMWDEDRTGATGENCSGNSAVDLKCYTMTVEF